MDNEIRCLQGGVQVPTGGRVRERFGFQRQLIRCDSGSDSKAFAESGWKKVLISIAP